MKIYSWKLLMLSIFLVGGITYGIFHWNGWTHMVIIVLAALKAIQSFYYALTQEGYEVYARSVDEQKKTAHVKLGKFAFLDGMAPIILLLLSWITSVLVPAWRWLIGLFLIFAVILMIKSISQNLQKEKV